MRIFILRKLLLLSLLLISIPCFAGVNNITELDGSPSVYPWKLKVSNGTLTDNGDGSASLTTGGSSIGGTLTGGTTGSVLFVGAGPIISQDNANFFWDVTNHRLGLGVTTPTAQLDDDMNTSSGTSDLIQAWRWIGDVNDYGLRLYQRHTGSSIVYDLEIRNNSTTDLPAITFKADGSIGIDNTAPTKTLDVTGTIGVSGHTTFEGVTSTGATGTGKLVYDGSPTLTTAVLGSSTATTQTSNDNSTKVATTAYVDNAALGQNYKEAAKYASTGALPAVVYANGSSGVGATLTGVAASALSLDSSSPSVADRVLIKNQASSFQNGIYTVTATGSGIAVFVMTRATDTNQSAEFKTGDAVFVTAGTTLANTSWAYTGVDSPTMGTDALTYAQFAGPGSITLTGDVTSVGNVTTVAKIQGTTVSGTSGSVNVAFTTSPSFTTPTIGGVAIPSISSTNTFTNKRITTRTGTTTSSATPTINTDNVNFYTLTAQTADITSFTTNLSGTPTENQKLWISITGTAARAITWGSSFEASDGVALPTTTVSTHRLDVGFAWNTATSKWRCVASV